MRREKGQLKMIWGSSQQGTWEGVRPQRVITRADQDETGLVHSSSSATAGVTLARCRLRWPVMGAALVIAAAPTSSNAAEPIGWTAGDIVIRTGPAVILFDGSAEVKVNGADVPGGSIGLSNNVTVTAEIEYFLSRSVSVAGIVGIPPRTRIRGTGNLSSVGEVGRVRYGLGVLVVRYHLNSGRRLSPYVGGGIVRFIAFSSKDGAVTQLHTESAWGPALQGGIDYHINDKLGLYASVAFVPIKTNAQGIARGLPATGRITADPTVFQGGLSYRF